MNKTGHDTSVVDLRIKSGILEQPKRILRPRNELKSYAETPDVIMQEYSNYSSDAEQDDEEMPMEPVQVKKNFLEQFYLFFFFFTILLLFFPIKGTISCRDLGKRSQVKKT